MLLLEGGRVEIRLRPTCRLLQPLLVHLPGDGDIVAKLPGDVGGKESKLALSGLLSERAEKYFTVKSNNCLAAAALARLPASTVASRRVRASGIAELGVVGGGFQRLGK